MDLRLLLLLLRRPHVVAGPPGRVDAVPDAAPPGHGGVVVGGAVEGGLAADEAVLVVPGLADLGVDPGVEEEEGREGEEARGEDVVPVGAELDVARVHHQPVQTQHSVCSRGRRRTTNSLARACSLLMWQWIRQHLIKCWRNCVKAFSTLGNNNMVSITS